MSTLKSSAEDLTLNADGSGNDIKFQSNGSEVGSLTAEGVLTATSFAGSGAALTGLSSFDPDGAVTINDSGADVDFRIESDAITNAFFVDGATGNIGIGVNPEAWESSRAVIQLGTASGGTAAFYSTHDAVGMGENFYNNSGDKYINTSEATQYYQTDGSHVWKVAASGSADAAITWATAMTIENDGDVYLGSNTSASPWADTSGTGTFRFQVDNGTVNQCIAFSSGFTTSDYAMIYLNQIGGANDERFIAFKRSGSNVGTIDLDGTTGVSYNTSSDYRLKENVVPMTGSIDRLKELKPSRFNFIADADKTVDGFLAHEVSDYVPEAISGEKDAMTTEVLYTEDDELPEGKSVGDVKEPSVIDPQGIDQSKLVPLLTGALQEAVAKIEELTTRIETLENA